MGVGVDSHVAQGGWGGGGGGVCYGLAPEGVATCGVGVGGGGEAWAGVSDMAIPLDTAGEGGLEGAALGLGVAGAGDGAVGGGEGGSPTG